MTVFLNFSGFRGCWLCGQVLCKSEYLGLVSCFCSSSVLFGHNPSQSFMVRTLPTVSPTTEEVLSCFVHAVIIVKNVAPKTPNQPGREGYRRSAKRAPICFFGHLT